MTREQALDLLHDHVKNENLRRHCYAVEAVMIGLAQRLGGDKETWSIAGLLHDSDYEETKETATLTHSKETIKWLEEMDVDIDIRDAIAAHAWNYVKDAPEPRTPMQWALYTCDELTGLIVAVALIKPDKRLSSVSVDSILKKWPQKSFAAGVDRNQIEKCEEMLHIPLSEFITIALTSMQSIHEDLGL